MLDGMMHNSDESLIREAYVPALVQEIVTP